MNKTKKTVIKQPAIKIDGLSKIYGNGVKALKEVSLDVAEGDFFALLGPNGAGKSTLIGILTSLVNKSEGQVKVFGHDLDRQRERVKSCIGVVPQEFNFNSFEKLEDIIIQQAGYYGISYGLAKDRCHYYLHKLGIYEKRNSVSGSLSGGMKRRLMIARALVHEPKLLILDEPTAGVDIEIRRLMWDFLVQLNKQGTTIILTTHYLEEAEQMCRNIAIINKGSIIENTSMKKLLRKMSDHTYILDLVNPMSEPEVPASKNIDFRLMDEHTLEATINSKEPINCIFNVLTRKKIEVSSMRTKQNRLEELFLSLTSEKL